MIQPIICPRCATENEYTCLWRPGNQGIKATCVHCRKFIKFVKYDDVDFKKAMADAYKILLVKKNKGDMKADSSKIIARYPLVHPVGLIERLKMEWPEIRFTVPGVPASEYEE